MINQILIKCYDLFWYLCLPWVSLYLWWRGRLAPEYRLRWHERFACKLGPKQAVDLWFHAVSLGEVVAATPLIEACLAQGYRVLVSSMTPTGSKQIQRHFADRVLHQYCPYDLYFARQRFLNHYQPRLWVVVETELWPGWLWTCKQQSIPVILVNGRISNRSYGRYLASQWIWNALLNYFSALYVQSPQDRERFLSLGVHPQHIFVAGNLKFHPQDLSHKLKFWQDFKAHYPKTKWMVFASTHEGEEAKLLKVWLEFKARHPDWKSIWVPRHPERFQAVYRLLAASLPRLELASQWASTSDVDALLLDKMGELAAVYGMADMAFVGGSLVSVGGHNILEPMVFGLPVLTGPFMQNQQDLVRLGLDNQVLIVAQDETEVLNEMLRITENEGNREALQEKIRQFFKMNQQALSICLEGIRALAPLDQRR
jgi:3-deoxy-D-manno-octulosonic-acid transferase